MIDANDRVGAAPDHKQTRIADLKAGVLQAYRNMVTGSQWFCFVSGHDAPFGPAFVCFVLRR